MRYTNNFQESEFIKSATATANSIDNGIKDESHRLALQALCTAILQPTRDKLGVAFIISSGYRVPALNSLVGGVSTSQHVIGEAADIKTGDPVKLYKYLRDLSGLDYDQIILYPTFVHVSYKRLGGNRKQSLYAKGVKPV